MRRKRYQRGSVRLRTRAGQDYWYAQWREDDLHRSKELGPCSTMSADEAHALLARIVRPINERNGRKRRNRYQRGSVQPRTRGGKQYWYAQWRDEGLHRSKELGLCSGMTSSEAHSLLAEIVRPINERNGLGPAPDLCTTLRSLSKEFICRCAAADGRFPPK